MYIVLQIHLVHLHRPSYCLLFFSLHFRREENLHRPAQPASICTFSQSTMFFTFPLSSVSRLALFPRRPHGNGGAVLTALHCNCGGFKKQERAAIDRIFWSLICATTFVSDPAPTSWNTKPLWMGFNCSCVNFRTSDYCPPIRDEFRFLCTMRAFNEKKIVIRKWA